VRFPAGMKATYLSVFICVHPWLRIFFTEPELRSWDGKLEKGLEPQQIGDAWEILLPLVAGAARTE
jgi:hypothetical protein